MLNIILHIMLKFRNKLATSCATLLLAGAANAAVIYQESLDGDLSGAFASPTAVTLSSGVNSIIGQTGNNGNGGAIGGTGTAVSRDADYFTFSVTAGQVVNSISIASYTFSPSDPGVSFMGFRMAASFSGQGSGDIDGQSLFNASSGDIISGLTGSSTLGPGDYSVWVQETSDNVVDYQLDINVVPEPSSALLVILGGCGFVLRRSRR